MLDPYASVVAYSAGGPNATDPTVIEEPGYICIAHNLSRWDAGRLTDRLQRQYDLTAMVVLHLNRHDEQKATDCEHCQLLFEEIIERAAKAMGETHPQVIPG